MCVVCVCVWCGCTVFLHMCFCVLCMCVVWMCGVCTYVCVCVWECVCMCWKVAGIFTCYSDSATEALENTLPQTQLIFIHRLYTKCCWKVGKQKEPGQSFREINPRLGGMLGLSKLGSLLPVLSWEDWGGAASSSSLFVQGVGSWRSLSSSGGRWSRQPSVVRASECQQAGHCLDRKDLPFCQHCSICLLPPPWEFVTGSLWRSQGSEHSQDEPQAAAGQDSGVVPFSGLANKSKSSLVQRIFLVVYSKC